jgi:signal transduction histidine kinase
MIVSPDQLISYTLTIFFAILSFVLWRKVRKYQKQIKSSREIGQKFITTVPHQVRPPLTVLKGYSSMILEGDYGQINPELARIFRGMSVSTDNLIDICNDYIDLADLIFGEVHYSNEKIDVKKVLEQLIKRFEQNQSIVKFELKESWNGPYVVNGDLKQITAVYRRLLENAVKYTPKGCVIINLSKDGEKSVSVSIQDEGIGIAKSDISNLFNKFYRAQNAKDTTAVGTGLGLYINTQIVKAHKGRIWVESDGISKGTKVSVELPIKR